MMVLIHENENGTPFDNHFHDMSLNGKPNILEKATISDNVL